MIISSIYFPFILANSQKVCRSLILFQLSSDSQLPVGRGTKDSVCVAFAVPFLALSPVTTIFPIAISNPSTDLVTVSEQQVLPSNRQLIFQYPESK